MSYIDKQSTALVRVKLTDIGREQLAKGQLTFTSWLAGDSEVDYGYVNGWKQFVPSSNAATGEFFFYGGDDSVTKNIYSKVLRPKDKQPFFTSFLTDNTSPVGNFIIPLNSQSSVQLIKGVVSNEADDRGFFSGSTVDVGLSAVTTTDFIKEKGTIDLSLFTGEIDTTPYIQGVISGLTLTATSADDFIMFRFSNPTLGNVSGDTMTAATINQFYNITEISGSTIKVDRELPTLSGYSGTVITYYTFPGGDDPTNDYYGAPSTVAYWDTGTLSFDSNCDICVENIPVWNMNNVWSENMAGQWNEPINNYHNHTLFGSEQYAGTKQFLGYNTIPSVSITNKQSANSYIDPFKKGVSIIHYTNGCISTFYGEMFNIDSATGKLLNLDIPVMWHRRNDVGTGSGTTLGMRFTSDAVKKTINNGQAGTTDIEYYDLIEFSGMSVTPSTPLAVGKVFPNLKIVVIDNEELLAAMSYKSNRNYTLPDLSASFINPIAGECNGVVKPGESLYLTYTLKLTGSTGYTPTLPCQRYSVIDNTTIGDKDVQFAINNIDQLPYMRKTENAGYDGYGFYADQFVLLAQVIDKNITSRPYPDQWREIDFTSTNITGGAGETIDPLLLQNQNSNNTGFILTKSQYTGATTFDLGTEIDLARGLNYGKLNFGDERLFYGNLRTHIGATIYKTLFLVNVDGAVMGKSTNPTFSVGSDRWVSEIGILDNNSNLVLVGKLSRPIRIADSTTASIELTIDF
jgi:hypothetical protein|tara:strand:- start:663 stop:2888 length:2226 start_codon:yes stop_codon:yes gene_type:complete